MLPSPQSGHSGDHYYVRFHSVKLLMMFIDHFQSIFILLAIQWNLAIPISKPSICSYLNCYSSQYLRYTQIDYSSSTLKTYTLKSSHLIDLSGNLTNPATFVGSKARFHCTCKYSCTTFFNGFVATVFQVNRKNVKNFINKEEKKIQVL